MILTDEKDAARWETIAEFNIIKRDAIDLAGEEPQLTITGAYGDWELGVTSNDRGSLAEAVLTRTGVERYSFVKDSEQSDIIAKANNTNQDMSSMLHIAATLIRNPDVTWS